MTDEEIKKLKDEINTWKEASSANSYKAFQLQEENKTLSMHILELQKDKGELVDDVKSLKAQIEQLVYLHEEDVSTIKLLNKQIEKTKCCYNCKQSQDESYCKIKKSDVNDLSCWDCGCDKWEIKE